MGMSTGASLAKQNVKTLLIDAFDPPHNQGSHHGETRMIRHAYGEGKAYVNLVKRAQQLWQELEQETGEKIFNQTGVLGLGSEASPFLKETIEASEKFDLPLTLFTSGQVKERWPGITIPNDYIGIFESDSGLIYSENAIKAYKNIALNNGADFLPNTKVSNIDMSEEKIQVETANGVYHGKKVIVTAGAWMAKLLDMIELPIQPVRKVFGWFDPLTTDYESPQFPAFYIDQGDRMFYGFPNENGHGVKMGRTDGGQDIDPDQHVQDFGKYDSDEGEMREVLQQHFPKANGELIQGKACLLTSSVDHDFIIDHHPNNENVIIAGGFSGHGFKFSSVIGEILGQLAIDGRTEHDITKFSLSRF